MWWTVVQLVVLALLEGEGDGLHGLPPIEPRVQALLKMITKQGEPKSGEREKERERERSLFWYVRVVCVRAALVCALQSSGCGGGGGACCRFAANGW